MKHTLLIITALMLIVGCSESDAQQKVITVTETYNDGDVSKISYHKITGNKIELVKEINWYKNGQKREEGTFKDGEKDGVWTEWYKNGQKWYEATYKDGEVDGKWTGWWDNGQKKYERTYKDGKNDGLGTWWHENGQKSSERTFKDGEVISQECWDKDGNEMDCPW
jgi:antitoxin component YwqK of YwqJK toxin-antitoxin module